MRRAFLIVGVILLPSLLFSQPKIAFPDGASFDFGEMTAGARPTRTLSVENRGSDTLRISNVTVQCNCSTVRILTREIPPGGQGAIEVTFRSDFDRGAIQKNLSIISNDPSQKISVVWFRATVLRYLDCFPRLAAFTRDETIRMSAKEISVANQDTGVVTLFSAVDSAALVRIEGAGVRIQPGGSVLLKATANAVGEENREGTIVLHSDSPRQPVTRIRYFIEGSRRK